MENVLDLISSLVITTDRELQFIKSNDWTANDLLDKRESKHELHQSLAQKALVNAKEIVKLAGSDVKKVEIKSFLEKLLSFSELYIARATRYLQYEDWTKAVNEADDQEKALEKAQSEIEFQRLISSNIFKFKNEVSKLNIGDEDKLNIPELYNNQKAPMAMRDLFEERYPELREYIAEKLKIGQEALAKKKSKPKTKRK